MMILRHPYKSTDFWALNWMKQPRVNWTTLGQTALNKSLFHCHLTKRPNSKPNKKMPAIMSISFSASPKTMHAMMPVPNPNPKSLKLVDLSRFSAAPGAHLSGDPFKSQGAFPA
jgi:hypothetical protein